MSRGERRKEREDDRREREDDRKRLKSQWDAVHKLEMEVLEMRQEDMVLEMNLVHRTARATEEARLLLIYECELQSYRSRRKDFLEQKNR